MNDDFPKFDGVRMSDHEAELLDAFDAACKLKEMFERKYPDIEIIDTIKDTSNEQLLHFHTYLKSAKEDNNINVITDVVMRDLVHSYRAFLFISPLITALTLHLSKIQNNFLGQKIQLKEYLATSKQVAFNIMLLAKAFNDITSKIVHPDIYEDAATMKDMIRQLMQTIPPVRQ